jgi:hypothetical protein
MSLSRRDILIGGLAFGGAGCGSSAPPPATNASQPSPVAALPPHAGELPAQRSVTAGTNPVVSIEGMIACVFPTFKIGDAVTRLALDCALMDVTAEDPTLPYHAASLMLPRVLLERVEALPTAVDDYYAYWSLDGTHVEVNVDSDQPFKTNSEIPEHKDEPATAKEWASTWWMHSLNDMYGIKGPVDGWRHSSVVASVVRFGKGATVEPPYTTDDISKLPDFERPQGQFDFVKKSKPNETNPYQTLRTYKHAVRVELDFSKGITFEIYSYRDRRVKRIWLKKKGQVSEADRVIRLSNYPALWRERKKDVPQADTVVYGALCGKNVDDRYIAVFRKDPKAIRVNGCDCCLDPMLNEEVQAQTLQSLW